jgi:hypothetical protein
MELFLNKYLAKILTALAALVVVILLFYMFRELRGLVALRQDGLPLVAIGGVVVLVLLLTAVATMFSILDLTNKDQAMGLPEGSIRAVIALSLIVLFAILSIFLYQNVSKGSDVVNIDEMSTAERTEFMRNPYVRDFQSAPVAGKAGFHTVSYRNANPASDDFAKQLLILLGTLMTAVTSFYLGAGTATSGSKLDREALAASASAAAPTFTGPKTTKHSKTTDGPTRHLEIIGTNLDGISRVRLVRTGETPIDGTGVTPAPTKVTCDLDLTGASTGTWSIEVAEGARPAKVAGSLEITA